MGHKNDQIGELNSFWLIYPNLGDKHFCYIVWFPTHISSVFLLQGTAADDIMQV